MISAPLPYDEQERLQELHGLGILYSLEEQPYDDLTQLAAQICDVPIALISLIDRDCQFLKSHHGLDINAVSRELGFCPHAILDNDLTIVEDASKDVRFHDNPLVTGEPHVKFYAGAPLIFSGNLRLGTLCVIDHKARSITPEQQKALKALARQVVSQLELRQTVKEIETSNKHQSVVVAKLKQSEARERHHSNILEKLAKGSTLDEVLTSIVYSIEDEIEGSLCSILLLDDEGKHLLHGAAPNLPKFYNDAIHNLEIGPCIGSCGTAAHSGQRIIVEDINTHPYWSPYKGLAGKAGLAACWSEPIFSSEGNILGTFAIYHPTPHAPDDACISVIEYAANLAGISIQRKQEEKALLAAKHIAENANQAKSKFLSVVSHELRTPLTSIKGALGLLSGGAMTDKPDQVQEMLRIAYDNSERLSYLVDDILDFEKSQSGKMIYKKESIKVKELISKAIKITQGYAEHYGIHFAFRMNGCDCSVFADEKRLQQVLANLISNAVKYSPAGGSVLISTQCDYHIVRIAVKDQGEGIPKEFHDRIFTHFSQADTSNTREKGGSGLGLAIAKEIIDHHGGKIGFDSPPGQGATIYFELDIN